MRRSGACRRTASAIDAQRRDSARSMRAARTGVANMNSRRPRVVFHTRRIAATAKKRRSVRPVVDDRLAGVLDGVAERARRPARHRIAILLEQRELVVLLDDLLPA